MTYPRYSTPYLASIQPNRVAWGIPPTPPTPLCSALSCVFPILRGGVGVYFGWYDISIPLANPPLIDRIMTLWIDNSRSPGYCYAYFNDTNQLIEVPPFTQGYYSVTSLLTVFSVCNTFFPGDVANRNPYTDPFVTVPIIVYNFQIPPEERRVSPNGGMPFINSYSFSGSGTLTISPDYSVSTGNFNWQWSELDVDCYPVSTVTAGNVVLQEVNDLGVDPLPYGTGVTISSYGGVTGYSPVKLFDIKSPIQSVITQTGTTSSFSSWQLVATGFPAGGNILNVKGVGAFRMAANSSN